MILEVIMIPFLVLAIIIIAAGLAFMFWFLIAFACFLFNSNDEFDRDIHP